MSKTSLETMALNAKLGDGGIYKQGKSFGMKFTSTSLDYITYKRDMLASVRPTPLRTQKSGYDGKKTIYTFSVRHTAEAERYYNMSYCEAIDSLEDFDLMLWLLDDGSVHKTKGTFHLYSNRLSEQESIALIAKIHQLHPITMPKLRIDRKKDGRAFYYIYLPRILAEVIQADMRMFLEYESIESLSYKASRKYTLNDHRTASGGRPPIIGPATLEPSRVGQYCPKQEGLVKITKA